METTVNNQKTRTIVDMEVSEGRRIHLSIGIGTGGQAQTIEAIFVPPYVYARAPGAVWLRLNSEILAATGGDFAELLDDPLGFRGALYPSGPEGVNPDIYRIVGVSRDVTDGFETDHLQIEIDFQTLLGTLSEAQLEEKFGVFLGDVNLFPNAMDILSQIRSPTLEVWIDDDGYTRKVFLEMKAGDVYSTLVRLLIFDVNEVIAINPPQEFEVIPE